MKTVTWKVVKINPAKGELQRANVLAQITGKKNLPGTHNVLINELQSWPTVRSPEDSAYLFIKQSKKTKQKKSICRHVFSCPVTPIAFSASRGFCAPEACVSGCACCSARKGLAAMAPWPWLWAPGSRLLMGSWAEESGMEGIWAEEERDCSCWRSCCCCISW